MKKAPKTTAPKALPKTCVPALRDEVARWSEMQRRFEAGELHGEEGAEDLAQFPFKAKVAETVKGILRAMADRAEAA